MSKRVLARLLQTGSAASSTVLAPDADNSPATSITWRRPWSTDVLLNLGHRSSMLIGAFGGSINHEGTSRAEVHCGLSSALLVA